MATTPQAQYWAPIQAGYGHEPRTICPRQCGGTLTAEADRALVKWTCNNPGCGYTIHS